MSGHGPRGLSCRQFPLSWSSPGRSDSEPQPERIFFLNTIEKNYQTTHRLTCKHLFKGLDFCQASPQTVFVSLKNAIRQGVLHDPVSQGLHVNVIDGDNVIPAALIGTESSVATGRGCTWASSSGPGESSGDGSSLGRVHHNFGKNLESGNQGRKGWGERDNLEYNQGKQEIVCFNYIYGRKNVLPYKIAINFLLCFHEEGGE